MVIPDFREDGYLPIGVHKATEDEVRARFGVANEYRINLMARLSKWLALARVVGAERFLLNGSFVTAKPYPNDVDCVCWLPRDFRQQWQWGRYEAISLQESVYRGEPRELYDCYTLLEWNYWLDLFSLTREPDSRQKGMIEVVL